MKTVFSNDINDIKKIHFDIQYSDHKYKIFNATGYDTETSSAFLIDNKAFPFDKERYCVDKDYQKTVDDAIKISIPYMWQWGIYDSVEDCCFVFWGRELSEYENFLKEISKEAKRQYLKGFKTRDYESDYKSVEKDKYYVKMICGVHNLPFDFQFLRNIHNASWCKHRKGRGAVFARTMRRPMKATAIVNKLQIEYHDTAVLVGMSLAKWGKTYNLPVCKMKVDEDFYLKILTPVSKLDQLHIDYACTDIVTMLCGINQFITRYGDIYKVPLTQASTARISMLNACGVNQDWIQECYDVTQGYGYDMFVRFVHLQDGGYVHANFNYVNKLLDENFAEKKFGDKSRKIYNHDYSSDYPYCACVFKHPIGQWTRIDPKYFDDYAREDVLKSNVRWFAKVKCRIKKSNFQNSFWSLSHVIDYKNFVGEIDNGRIRSCKNDIVFFIADVEWEIFEKVYEIEDFECLEMFAARAGRLPKELIEWILDRYCAKTELKREDDDPEYEETLAAYQHAKIDINAGGYGVFVTKVLMAGVDYDETGWHNDHDKDELKIENQYETIMKSMSDKKTFTQYPVGIWITKWAKWRLWSLITGRWFDALDRRTVYNDTDSLKGFLTEKDLENIDKYNEMITNFENDVANEIGIDPKKFAPKDKNGTEWRLGLFTREKTAEAMVTLGAKKYAVQYADGKIKTTISGLPKDAGPKKFKKLSDMLIKSKKGKIEFNAKESEKKALHYNDEQPCVIWTDEDGIEYKSEYKYGCAILPTTFKVGLSSDFEDFLDGMIDGNIGEFFEDGLLINLMY